jgi:hypothetical protein
VYFGIIFPEMLALDRRFPWIKWIVIWPMLVRAVLIGIAGACYYTTTIWLPGPGAERY